jgi:hypothetical protein
METKLSELSVDQRCQQPLREGKVREMCRRGFDLALAGVLTVSARQNNPPPVTLDGQTRSEAAKRCGVEVLPAIVWYGLTLDEEAWLFTYLNKKSNPTAISTFKSRVVVGEDTPNAIVDILAANGWTVDTVKTSDGQFAAVAAAEKIYDGRGEFRFQQRTGEEIFTRTIETVTDAWGLSKDGVSAGVITGMAVFLGRYWDDVNQKRLVTSLERITPVRLHAEAADAQKSLHVRVAAAHGWRIHQEYNRNRRDQLPPFLI